MNETLGDLLFKTCLVYLDDVVVFGEDFAETLKRAKEVIRRIVMKGLKLGGLKCEFFLKRVKVLGKVVENGDMFPDEEKT